MSGRHNARINPFQYEEAISEILLLVGSQRLTPDEKILSTDLIDFYDSVQIAAEQDAATPRAGALAEEIRLIHDAAVSLIKAIHWHAGGDIRDDNPHIVSELADRARHDIEKHLMSGGGKPLQWSPHLVDGDIEKPIRKLGPIPKTRRPKAKPNPYPEVRNTPVSVGGGKDYGSYGMVLTALIGVQRLAQWTAPGTAMRSATYESQEPSALNIVELDMLPEIYEKHFGEVCGLSSDGPGNKFMAKVLELCGRPVELDSLKQRRIRHQAKFKKDGGQS